MTQRLAGTTTTYTQPSITLYPLRTPAVDGGRLGDE